MTNEKYENPILKAVGDIFNKLVILAAIVTFFIVVAGCIKALYHIVMLCFGKPWPEDFPKVYGWIAIPLLLFILWALFGWGDQPGILNIGDPYHQYHTH